MLDSLLQWLQRIWDSINPFVIIDQYEGAILLRMGKKKRDLTTGFHFLPLKIVLIDKVLSKIVTRDTISLIDVHITTSDGKTVSVGTIIDLEVVDVSTFLLDFNDADSNMKDVCRGVVTDYLTDISWEEMKKKSTLTAIKNKLKNKLSEMGVNVHQVYFSSMVLTRAFTIFSGKNII